MKKAIFNKLIRFENIIGIQIERNHNAKVLLIDCVVHNSMDIYEVL